MRYPYPMSTTSPDTHLHLHSPELFRRIGDLVHAAGGDDFYDQLAELAANLVNCDRWLVVRYSRYDIPEFIVNRSMSAAAVKSYHDGLYRLDPLLRLARNGPRTGVITLRRLQEIDARNAYFDELFRSALIFDELAILLAAPGRITIAVCLDRSSRQFTSQEVERGEILFPLMESIHDSHLERLFVPSTGGGGIFGGDARQGIMILDRCSQPVFTNPAWREFEATSASGLVGMIHRNRDRGMVSLGDKTVLHWERLGDKFAIAPNGTICIVERRGADYLTRNFEDALTEFSKNHGLTPREVSIVSLVLRGFTNALIASELNISPGTVRNHRHRLYNKLDITTERELFYLFLRMLTGDTGTTKSVGASAIDGGRRFSNIPV